MTSLTGFCFSGGKALGDFGALRFVGVELPESEGVEPAGVELAKGAGVLSGVADAELA
jgi:hypothetical protein